MGYTHIPFKEFQKMYFPMGWNIFSCLEIKQAIPARKNIFIFVQNLNDGIGDYIHAKNFCAWIKRRVGDKRYSVGLFLQTECESNDSDTNQVNYIIGDLKKNAENFCDRYWIFRNRNFYERSDGSINRWLKKKKYADLVPFIQGSCGALLVSFQLSDPVDEFINSQIDKANVPLIYCCEYGADSYPIRNEVNFLTRLDMGLPIANDSLSAGIEIYENIHSLDKIATILQLEKNEPEFIRYLLFSSLPIVQESILLYLDTHYFMPGYLQSESAAIIFILSHVYAIRKELKSSKKCDFLLPPHLELTTLLTSLLIQMDLIYEEDEIEYISKHSISKLNQNANKIKIRIFQLKIKSNEDYHNLYGITNDGAACSGDNSTSLVFSSGHMPFCEYKRGTIGDNFYKIQLIGFIVKCKNELSEYDPPLSFAMKKLIKYFTIMVNIQENYVNKSDTPKLVALVKKLAKFKSQPEVEKAWLYVSQIIKSKFNIFDSLQYILCFFSNNSNFNNHMTIKHMLIKSAEIQFLIENEWITTKAILKMDLLFLDEISKPKFINSLPNNKQPYINPLIYRLLPVKDILMRIHEVHNLICKGILKRSVLLDESIGLLYFTGILNFSENEYYYSKREVRLKVLGAWNVNLILLIKKLKMLKNVLTEKLWFITSNHLFTFLEKTLKVSNQSESNTIRNIANIISQIDPTLIQFKKLVSLCAEKYAFLAASRAGLFVSCSHKSTSITEKNCPLKRKWKSE